MIGTRKLQREARQCVDALDSARVLFYADPLYEQGAFDCSPFCRFADVDLFVYAGRAGTEDALWNLLQSLQDQPPVSYQLGLCSRGSALGPAYISQAGGGDVTHMQGISADPGTAPSRMGHHDQAVAAHGRGKTGVLVALHWRRPGH